MKSFTLDLVALTVLCCGLVYSAGRTLSDLAETADLEREIAQRAKIVAQLEDARDSLADRVARMTGPEIDPELLDEQMRKTLGVGRANEVLLLPPLGQ